VAASLSYQLFEPIGQTRGRRNIVDYAGGQGGLPRHVIPDLKSRCQAIPKRDVGPNSDVPTEAIIVLEESSKVGLPYPAVTKGFRLLPPGR
jgi:hypothetical protein